MKARNLFFFEEHKYRSRVATCSNQQLMRLATALETKSDTTSKRMLAIVSDELIKSERDSLRRDQHPIEVIK